MVTRSILGRIVLIGILVASLAVIGHAAFLWSSRKPPKTQAAMSTEETTVNKGEASTVRVVYPGPDTGSDGSPPKVTRQLPPTPFPDPTARTLDAQGKPPVQAAPPNAVAAPLPVPTAAPPVAPAPTPGRVVDTRAIGPRSAALDPAPDARTGPGAGHDSASSPGGKPPGGGLNINSASIEALNQLPGGGHIGVTIARHRPYASIEDLVRKRVLRRNVFDRIKGKIATE